MAIYYKVCSEGFAVTSTITMSEGSCGNLRVYTNAQGNEVRETSKVLRFNTSVVSDNDFRINYTYTKKFYINGILESTITVNGIVTMPAGHSYTTKEVICIEIITIIDASSSGDKLPYLI